MTKLVKSLIKVVTEHPGFSLYKGRVCVSSGSDCALSRVDSLAFAACVQKPLQTGDIAVLVRYALEDSPVEDAVDPRDGSDKYQNCSDIALFRGKEMFASDLERMYPGDFKTQGAIVEKIGCGIEVSSKDELATRLLDTAGNRRARIPSEHWPYAPWSKTLGRSKVARVFLPLSAEFLGSRLHSAGYSQCRFYLISRHLPQSLQDGQTCVVRPVGLGGCDFDINDVVAYDIYDYDGRARAGSVAKNFSIKIV